MGTPIGAEEERYPVRPRPGRGGGIWWPVPVAAGCACWRRSSISSQRARRLFVRSTLLRWKRVMSSEAGAGGAGGDNSAAAAATTAFGLRSFQDTVCAVDCGSSTARQVRARSAHRQSGRSCSGSCAAHRHRLQVRMRGIRRQKRARVNKMVVVGSRGEIFVFLCFTYSGAARTTWGLGGLPGLRPRAPAGERPQGGSFSAPYLPTLIRWPPREH